MIEQLASVNSLTEANGINFSFRVSSYGSREAKEKS